MFKKLTIKEQLRKERAKNTLLATKIKEQENAIFDLAKLLSEVKNGETISEQNK